MAAIRPADPLARIAIVLLALAQGLVAGYLGAERHLPWLAGAVVLLLLAVALVLARDLRRAAGSALPHPLALGALLAAALALGLVQGFALVPETARAATWTFAAALLAGGLVAALRRDAGGGPLLLAAFAVPCLFAIVQLFALPPGPARSIGETVDVNHLADLLAIGLLIGVGVLQQREASRPPGARPERGPLIALLLVTAALSLAITLRLESRAVALLLPAGLAVLALRAGPSGLWLVIAGAAGLMIAALADVLGGAVAVATDGQGGTVAGAFSRRGQLVEGALELLEHAPLLGSGLQSFALLYPSVRRDDDATAGVFVHNDYLQLLLEGGLAFVLPALGLVMLLAWCAWRHLRALATGPDVDRVRLSALVVAGLLAVHALANFTFYTPMLAIGFAVAVAVAVGEVGPAPATRRRASTPLAIAGLLAALVCLPPLLIQARGLTRLQGASPLPGVAGSVQPPEARYGDAARLAQWLDDWSLPRFVRADLEARLLDAGGGGAERQRLVDAADRGFARAIAINPYVPEYAIQYARFLRNQVPEAGERGLVVLEGALVRDPFAARAWLALAYNAREAGALDDRRAAEWLARFTPRCGFMARRDPASVRAFLSVLPRDALEEAERACDDLAQRWMAAQR